MEERLKPCPFCGGKGQLIQTIKLIINHTDGYNNFDDQIFWVKCHICQFSSFRHPTAHTAVDAWNKRIDNQSSEPMP